MLKEVVAIRKLPVNIYENDYYLFEHELYKNWDYIENQILDNIVILGNSIFDLKKAKFYFSASKLTPLTIQQRLGKILLLFSCSKERFETGIWITDDWSSGYFHWFTDALTRLMNCMDLAQNHPLLLPLEYKQNRFIIESIKLLGIKHSFFSMHKPAFVKKLFVPGHTAPTGNYDKELIEKVRAHFCRNPSQIPYKKIFISRNKAKKRRISNEQELLPIILKFGFEVHCFEDYSLEQQITIMNETKFLIGLHGAGLTNMLFMPARGKILELRNLEDRQNNCYFSLASDLDHDYYYLLNAGDTQNTHKVNITVEVSSLEKVLFLMDQK